MTRRLILIAAIILPAVIMWTLHGFVMWDWDPGNWSEGARASMAFLSVATAVPFVGAVVDIFYTR